MPRDLTAKQAAVYNFLRSYYLSHGMPPTIRAVCQEFGFNSTNGVLAHYKALVKKGWIRPAARRFVTARPDLVVTRERNEVRVAVSGPGVTYTAEEWRDWLRNECKLAGVPVGPFTLPVFDSPKVGA